MKCKLLIFLLLLSLTGWNFACKRYKTTPRLQESELELAEMAVKLAEESDRLGFEADDSIKGDYDQYLEAANKFNHAAQRFGPSSLQGRDAFDKMNFQASQLEQKLRTANLPDFLEKWETLKKDHISKIGRRLGYRMEPES